jgi:hypothetical protein
MKSRRFGPGAAKEKPSIATVAELLARRNREAAEIILADPERYPAGSAMAIWAAMVMRSASGESDCPLRPIKDMAL